jgi:hypothetical protein
MFLQSSQRRRETMNPDILIVRENNGFRLLHGHLRLATVISGLTEVTVNVIGEGEATVVATAHGYLVEKEGQRLPLR